MDNSALDTAGIEIKDKAPLCDYTTFRLGGVCRRMFNCRTPRQVEDTVRHLVSVQTPFILIGGGSNLVVSDEGVDCAVVRFVSDEPIVERNGMDVTVSAGTLLDQLALYCARQGLEGLNYTSGIPGTVGGAVVGNAGAFGKQVGDVLKSVVLLSPSGVRREAGAAELGFRYRDSILKETGEIVLSATFTLSQGKLEQLLKERDELLAVRHQKHPDLRTHPCAGSFFRNIEPTSKAGKREAAGWFLEQAGAKDLRCGGAVIFEKHANIIVKSDGCRAQDVLELSRKMISAVKGSFGFELQREVRFVGKFEGVPFDAGRMIW